MEHTFDSSTSYMYASCAAGRCCEWEENNSTSVLGGGEGGALGKQIVLAGIA